PIPASPQVQAVPAPDRAAPVFADPRAPAPPTVAQRQSDDAPDRGRQAGAAVPVIAAMQRAALAPAHRPRKFDDEQAQGAVLFAKEWVPNDPMSHGGDGLGPVYNDTSCVACHGLGAPGGAGSENKNVVILTALAARNRRLSGELRRIHPGLVATRST